MSVHDCRLPHRPEPDYEALAGLEKYLGRVVEFQTVTGRWVPGRAAEACGYDPVSNTFVLLVNDGPLFATHVTDPYAIRLPR